MTESTPNDAPPPEAATGATQRRFDTSATSAPLTRTVETKVRLQGRGALLSGLATLVSRQYPLLALFVALAVIVGIVATSAFAIPDLAAWLASKGFGEDRAIKLYLAASIYDGVLLVGIYRLLTGLGMLGRERTALDQIQTRCSAYQEGRTKLDLHSKSDTQPFLYPTNGEHELKELATTAAVKMADAIRIDAAGRRFDPVNLVVERVSGNVTNHALGLRDAQQMGVRLGILGTFIGIVGSLANVGPLMQAAGLQNTAIQNSIGTIVDSLGAAFATSIAGLAASIVLQVLAGIMRTEETNIIEALERVAGLVQIICRRASEDTPLGADISALRTVLGEHNVLIRSQGKEMEAVSSRFGDALARTENTLAQPIRALEDTGRQLTGVFERQKVQLQELERITTMVADLETRVAGHFEDAAKRSAETHRRALEELTTTLRDSTTALREDVRSGWGSDARREFEALVDRRLTETVARLDTTATDQLSAMNRISLRLAIAMGAAMIALVLVAGQTTGTFQWLAYRLFG